MAYQAGAWRVITEAFGATRPPIIQSNGENFSSNFLSHSVARSRRRRGHLSVDPEARKVAKTVLDGLILQHQAKRLAAGK